MTGLNPHYFSLSLGTLSADRVPPKTHPSGSSSPTPLRSGSTRVRPKDDVMRPLPGSMSSEISVQREGRRRKGYGIRTFGQAIVQNEKSVTDCGSKALTTNARPNGASKTAKRWFKSHSSWLPRKKHRLAWRAGPTRPGCPARSRAEKEKNRDRRSPNRADP